MAHEVFISYAAADKAVADAVCRELEAHGVACWYAPRDVSYGARFEAAIVAAISASRFIVLVTSAHSIRSPHVAREVRLASLKNPEAPILPFRIEDVAFPPELEYYLASVQWLDASSSQPLEVHLRRLVEHVQSRLGRSTQPLSPPPAREPRQESQQESRPVEPPPVEPEQPPPPAARVAESPGEPSRVGDAPEQHGDAPEQRGDEPEPDGDDSASTPPVQRERASATERTSLRASLFSQPDAWRRVVVVAIVCLVPVIAYVAFLEFEFLRGALKDSAAQGGGSAANVGVAGTPSGDTLSREDFEKDKDRFADMAARIGDSFGPGADDGYVWAKVRRGLEGIRAANLDDISVEVSNGVVTLRGTVATEAERVRIVQAARRVVGDASLNDHLKSEAP